MKTLGEPADENQQGSLPVALKLGWGIGALGAAVLVNGISVLIFFYLVAILRIEPALAGAVVFAAKLLDVASDPIVGLWSDRLESPQGRRRPFLLWGAVISALSIGLIFATPIFERQWLTVMYVGAGLAVYTVGYTLFNVPYMAMPAEMTDSYHERSSIHAYRIVFVSLGGFLATAVAPAALEQMGRTEWISYAYVGIAGAIVVLISMLSSYFATRSARFTHRSHAVSKLVAEFSVIRKNRHFLRLIGVKFAQLTGVQTTQAALLFFIVQSLQMSLNILVLFGAVMTVSSIIAAPLLVRFSQRYGKRAAYYLAAGANIVYALSWSLASPGEPIWAIALRAILVGVALCGNVVMAMSMLTDIINHDAKKAGVRREGAYVSLYSFVEKLTAALGPLVIGVALSLVGFDTSLPSDVPQGDGVRFAILFAVSWLPSIMGVVAIWLLSGYRLTEADFVAGTRLQ